jgi:uncharacterized membrane protein YraQ (UPF0718 family)
MTLLTLASVGALISLALSAILSFIILPPVRSVLRKSCPTDDGVSFWTRFTILMLFLGPLIITLVFGVPSHALAERLTQDDQLLHVSTAALVGIFLALATIGLRMGTLKAPVVSTAPARKSDDQFIR